ncbi:MAG: Crp/Fnr family transcriptional regulator [Pseudomonadota bacterium]
MTGRKDVHNSDIPVVCQACEARHKGVCGALSEEQLLRLSKSTTKSMHGRDAILADAASDNPDTYANILSGVVKLTKLMPDGRQQIVGLQFAPDLTGRPMAANDDVIAEAATNVRLCSFPRAVLEDMLTESPEMERRLHRQTLAELEEARTWLLTLGRKSAAEKLASFLVLIADHLDPEHPEGEMIEFELPLKRADIADFLGLTTETISRQMTNLRKRGLINLVDRRIIAVPDLARLRRAGEHDPARASNSL